TVREPLPSSFPKKIADQSGCRTTVIPCRFSAYEATDSLLFLGIASATLFARPTATEKAWRRHSDLP
ncbi:MAG: hypothetical protein ACHP7B_02850, partial [Burkholderiales bacterium]